jgi:pentatricopeptide repeat protein
MQNHGTQPTVISFNSVLKACVNASMLDEAIQWLLKMQSQGLQPTVVSFNIIVNGCPKQG